MILVSSEHAFPFGLTRELIGFNLDNFSDFLYGGYVWKCYIHMLWERQVRHGDEVCESLSRVMTAGEAPPKDMLRVLRERWGMGPHLAHALVAHYGGHGR